MKHRRNWEKVPGYKKDERKESVRRRLQAERRYASESMFSREEMNGFHDAILNVGMVCTNLKKDMELLDDAISGLKAVNKKLNGEEYAEVISSMAVLVSDIERLHSNWVSRIYAEITVLYGRDIRNVVYDKDCVKKLIMG